MVSALPLPGPGGGLARDPALPVYSQQPWGHLCEQTLGRDWKMPRPFPPAALRERGTPTLCEGTPRAGGRAGAEEGLSLLPFHTAGLPLRRAAPSVRPSVCLVLGGAAAPRPPTVLLLGAAPRRAPLRGLGASPPAILEAPSAGLAHGRQQVLARVSATPPQSPRPYRALWRRYSSRHCTAASSTSGSNLLAKRWCCCNSQGTSPTP